MKNILALLVLAAAVVVSGCTAPASNDTITQDAVEKGDVMMNNSGDVMEKDPMQKEADVMMKDATHASYVPYSKETFDTAKASGKIVYLEFYAAWCPYCRAQEPKINEAFATMSKDPKYDTVAGFKVNYDTEKELKQQYGITYQHSHVILDRNGSVVVKSIGEAWSADDVIANINKAL